MTRGHGETLDLIVGTFVEQLCQAGVRNVCICPGSRSTPLALKLVEQPGLRTWMHLDERSAAYFALGFARARREPLALLATSGTATANFFPAVVEAYLSRVPLIVLTADRPHELREVGAAQTIDQVRLYGTHVKWFFDLPEPEDSPEALRLVSTTAARAVAEARADPPGPVHVNWPFREPLVPRRLRGSMAADTPLHVTVTRGRLAPDALQIERLSAELSATPRGLIVCGPQDDPDLPRALADLATALGYPILADPLSGVRYGPHDRSLVLDAYDAFLRHPDSTHDLEPEVVLAFGAPPTSKPLTQHLERLKVERYLLVDGGGGWRDPSGLASEIVHCDPLLLCHALQVAETSDPGWASAWTRLDRLTRRAIDTHVAGLDEPFEGGVFTALAQVLPDGATLFAGNSMPVRDLDTFLGGSERRWRALSNRGANGIDGVVSSAMGASAAGDGPVVLVIGDLSFYHDMNGLLAARRHDLDLLVVLVNNDGGGIFSFLPQADQSTEHFETLFGTPLGLDFRPFVEGYGGSFARVDDWSALVGTLDDTLHQAGLRVVEVRTDRQRNVTQHRQVWQAVAAALEPVAACA